MSMVTAWLAFPAIIVVLALGCGLALERAAGLALPAALLVPAGLAVVVVLGEVTTSSPATAVLTVPLAVVIATAGLAMSPPWAQRARFDWWAVAAAAAVFAVFAAPVVLSGHATFAGFAKLDDDSTWAAIVDRIMEHGRSLDGMAPASYRVALQTTLAFGYPVGAFVPVGVGARILHEDPLWVLQPCITLFAASLALVLYALLTPIVRTASVRAALAFIAAQPALLFGYAMWGGIKELAVAGAIALTVAVVPHASRRPGIRGALPFATAAGAVLAITSFAGIVWILPAIVYALAGVARRRGGLTALRLAASMVGVCALLALPAFAVASEFMRVFSAPGKLLGSTSDIGTLFGRLSPAQIFGIWPASDLRGVLGGGVLARGLIALAAAAAGGGLLFAARRRANALVAYAAPTVAFGIVISSFAGPWLGAKALAIAAPAMVLFALCGAVGLVKSGYELPGIVIAAAIATGVLLSNAVASHGITLAPRDQLDELDRIGHLAAGQGPTLITEYNPYASRHFLRAAEADDVSGARWRTTPLRTGASVKNGRNADTDDLLFDGVLAYRTLVVRRSPLASRPPGAYRLAWRGKTYEVWQRPGDFAVPLAHLSLGTPVAPGAVPRCRDVRNLAALVGRRGHLAAVPRIAPTVVGLAPDTRPVGWWKLNNLSAVPTATGTLVAVADVPATGLYRVWVEGAIRGELQVSVDGERAGFARGVINRATDFTAVGGIALRAGRHRVAITYRDGGLRPGSGGQETAPFPLGPVVLEPAAEQRKVVTIPSERWRTLCGQRLDWIEALAPAS